MEKEIPKWLDEAFLATVLQDEEHSKTRVTIVEFTAKSAVPPGNNYTSNVFRVNVKYTVGESSDQQTVSLIVKAPHEKGIMREISEKSSFFAKEPKIYQELLPKMYDKVKHKFGPKASCCPLKDGLVLRDLKSEGYVLCDRFKQLDFSHCEQVFSTLAKFHATSVALHHEDPEFIESMGKEQMYTEEGPMMKDINLWIEPVMKNYVGILNKIGEQKLSDLYSKRAGNIWESIKNIFKPQTNGLNVLNHGDCWVSNMMFKYSDSKEPVDVKFIDYQIARYTSPALDLLYFIWTSANEEVREHYQDKLYNIYTKSLNETLKQLGCKEQLTIEELYESLKSATDFLLLIICNTVPFIICDTNNVLDMEQMNREDFKTKNDGSFAMDETFLKLYNGKHYRALLPGYTRQLRAWLFS